MNAFSKEERVMFEDILEKFNDELVLSSAVNKYRIQDVTAERTGNTVWRPMPYIATSYDGIDQTGNFQAKTQLSVPSTISFLKSSNFMLDAMELRDGLQETRLTDAAAQKLASDINVAINTTAAMEGTLVSAIATAATGYDDVADMDAIYNEQGVPMSGRYAAYSSRDYNGMAGNLAERQTLNQMPTRAYRDSYVGRVAGFETFKMDYAPRLVAAAGGAITVSGANQWHIPVSTQASPNGGQVNVDNRYMTLTVSATANVKAGDAFTIAGVESVHHITKEATGQLKTFRVISVTDGTNLVISPAIVDGVHGGATESEKQYQNVDAGPADAAAITWLNIATAAVNPNWCKDAIELLPARLVMPPKGIDSMNGTTDQGVNLLITKQADINTLDLKYRLDVYFGTVCTQPEMAGVQLFGQT